MKANKAEIFDELEALSAHYVRVIRSPDQQERFYRDYLEDLTDYPLGAVKAACKAWRHSDSTKFPTPGQLLRFVRANAERDRDRAQPRIDDWRPLSDDEYERLSLYDKIRHQTILGNECRAKAGPMWSGGVGEKGRPAQRSAAKEAWATRAANHFAEAKRLRSFLMRSEQRA
jgi:hypothetical protein